MDDQQKIVMLLHCFAKTEAASALSVYAEMGGDASNVVVAPITDIIAPQKTAAVIEAIDAGHWPGGTPQTGEQKSALIANADKKNAVMLMRSFKYAAGARSDTAFAMVTETGKEWPVEEYIAHIRKEHEFMKTANPAEDPDMTVIEEEGTSKKPQ